MLVGGEHHYSMVGGENPMLGGENRYSMVGVKTATVWLAVEKR